jgi:cysteine synthase A
MIYENITQIMNNTPIVNASKTAEYFGARGNLFVKLEYLLPGMSKKDRVAFNIIKKAEEKGLLKPNQPVVELTSGNTGIGLALVCKQTNHPFTAVMSAGNSMERVKMIKALGADVILVEQGKNSEKGMVSGGDLALAEKKAKQLCDESGAFMASQFDNCDNAYAHEMMTAQEIYEQSNGCIDAFVDFIGTGGSFAGISMGLKAKNRNIFCYGVEPQNASYYKDNHYKGSHCIQGGGYFREITFFKNIKNIFDGFITVSDEEAIEACRILASYDGIFAGYSTGANAAAAIKLLQKDFENKNIIILANDTGLKYMSTSLWSE